MRWNTEAQSTNTTKPARPKNPKQEKLCQAQTSDKNKVVPEIYATHASTQVVAPKPNRNWRKLLQLVATSCNRCKEPMQAATNAGNNCSQPVQPLQPRHATIGRNRSKKYHNQCKQALQLVQAASAASEAACLSAGPNRSPSLNPTRY